MKIGICGLGMVGGSLQSFYKTPYIYDKYKNIGSIKELNNADTIFICVPTEYNGEGFDLNNVEEAISYIKKDKIIVLKSTVLPGTTDNLQKKHKQKILFNPEFLTEESATSDFKYPDKQIVGYTKKSYSIAKDIMNVLPLAPYMRIIEAKNAEMIKLVSNTYFCTKVTFANTIYDICKEKDLDYEIVKEGLISDKRVNNSHFEVWHKGYRGYAGKCLPKDSKALISFSKLKNIWLKSMDKFNDNLINNGKTIS